MSPKLPVPAVLGKDELGWGLATGSLSMSKAYPHFKPSYPHDELVEHFLLTPADLQFVLAFRGDANRLGVALLLKVLPYLGYVPEGFGQIPPEVRTFIAGQLGLLWDRSDDYPWYSSTRDYHLAQVRQFTGWRFPTAQDKVELEQWLRQRAAYEAHSADALMDSVCERLRQLRVELPAERELHRVVNSALSGFFQDIYRQITDSIPAEVRTRIDNLLMVPDSDVVSTFENIKADSGKPGVDHLQVEIEKLRAIRSVGLDSAAFIAVPLKVLQMLKRRATNEKASEMREHSDEIRYALTGCFLHVRGMEVTDEVTHMAVELIHRLDVRSEKQIHREWLADLERVDGKMQILSTVAEAVTEYPDGIVREVIFPRVKEETFRNLVSEFRVTGPNLRLLRQAVMQRKFARHYRRMVPALLETLQFRSDNRFQPIIEALTVIRRHQGSHNRHFPEAESIPIEGVVNPAWEERVFEEVGGKRRVNRRYYEICTLQKLQRALKCKEVWVEGAYAFRNPKEDMPGDWTDQERRILHYQELGKPLDAQTFARSLKERPTTALTRFNCVLPQLNHQVALPNPAVRRSYSESSIAAVSSNSL
jgi:Domain of unknown function (DUF4158)